MKEKFITNTLRVICDVVVDEFISNCGIHFQVIKMQRNCHICFEIEIKCRNYSCKFCQNFYYKATTVWKLFNILFQRNKSSLIAM